MWLDVTVTAKGLVGLLRELGVNRGSIQKLEFLEFMDNNKSRRAENFVIRLSAEQVAKLRRHITEEELKDRYLY